MKFFKHSSGVHFWIEKVGEKIWVHFKGRTFNFFHKKIELENQQKLNIQREPYLKSPLSGRVLSLKVKEGDDVQKGAVLVVIESMKIEHTLLALRSVQIKSILVKEGQSVESNEKLLIFE